MKSRAANPKRRARQASSPPAPTVYVAVDAPGVCVSASASPRPLRRKIPALLLASIAAISSISIGGRGAVFAEAVESPTPYGGDASSSTSEPNSDQNWGSDGQSSVVDERAGKIARALHPPEDDSTALHEEGNASKERSDDFTQYESKVQKQPYSSTSNRRQRRHMRQKQQQQDEEKQSPHSSQSENDAYMHWCERVLGIQSVVEIREFQYLDHLQLHWEDYEGEAYDEAGFDWLKQYSTPKDNAVSPEVSIPTKMVRGLAAKQDVQVGDIVISIPLYSLLSVPTTIDHDPVLSRILGPSARQKYGWTDTAEYEIALLVIAVLYHRSLGIDSPLSHYIDILVGTPTDSFPFLWSDKELRERAGDKGGEVKILARGIRQDLYEMYDAVMGTLVKKQPEWFAPPNGYDISGEVEGLEWAYSFENFRWAFALVISRHHYLPLKDIDYEEESPPKRPTTKNADPPSQVHQSTVSEAVPPANQPTDSWVDEAKNEEHVTEDDFVAADDDATIQTIDQRHSFLAPLADLINFGPPCLTGSYNAEEHMFELIATCPFKKGQEVTFYYSSECSDVIIANFGFLHPLVPPCLAEDWEKRSDEWEDKAKMREKELWEVYQKVDLLKDEMAVLESQLVSCGCEDGEKKEKQVYSMPTASTAEEHHKLRNGHHIRHDTGVRGRMNDQAALNKEMMEELG